VKNPRAILGRPAILKDTDHVEDVLNSRMIAYPPQIPGAKISVCHAAAACSPPPARSS
jgi:hypothetical protein